MLRRVELPAFGAPAAPVEIPVEEFDSRIGRLMSAVDADWVVVYGDREHAANLVFLTGFDARFEEALLILGPAGRRALLVGNEGLGHAVSARTPVDVRLCQSLSLMAQPRNQAPRITDLLRDVGIGAGARVGIVGWKYREAEESDNPATPSFVPAFLVDDLRHLTGLDPVDVTAAVMHPEHGVRSRNSAAQIAAFEWGAVRSSESVVRIVRGTKPGMMELEAAALMGYQGEPTSVHPIFASGKAGIDGLRSPTPRRLEKGDAVAAAVGYWGGLTCRAGLLSERPDDVFFTEVVRPYYRAIATWYEAMRIGASGSAVHRAVSAAFEGSGFGPLLNPGHLTSYDEWLHSPIRPESTERIASSMVFQCDIIPAPLAPGRALNCEDTVAIADASLREQLAVEFPELWSRIGTRRRFMEVELGLRFGPEVLPLSNMPAYLPPFWLDAGLVCTLGSGA